MKEIDFSNRKALERFQRNLNSHIFGNIVHGLRQLILIQDIIFITWDIYETKRSPDRYHPSLWRLVITQN